MLFNEALFFIHNNKPMQSKSCIDKLMESELEETCAVELLITKAESELLSGKYKESLKTVTAVLRNSLENIGEQKRNKLMKIRAEVLFNIGDFEHALLIYYKSRSTRCHKNIPFAKSWQQFFPSSKST